MEQPLLCEMDDVPVTVARHKDVTMKSDGQTSPVVVAVVMTVIYFALGVVYYNQGKPGLSLIEAVYFCVITITTVGEHGPATWESTARSDDVLLITCCFVIFGAGIIGTCLGIVLGWLLDREERLGKELAEEADVVFEESGSSGCLDWLYSSHTDVVTGNHGARNQTAMLTTFGIMALVLIGGAVAYEEIEGVSFVRAFYWACVTVTTVGYGDEYPKTDNGKLFAIGFIVFGTFLMAKCLAEIAQLPLKMRRLKQEARVLAQYGSALQEDELRHLVEDKAFDDLGITRERPGECTETEFVISMLLKLDKLKPSDVKRCAAVFGKLDASGDSKLSSTDIRESVKT